MKMNYLRNTVFALLPFMLTLTTVSANDELFSGDLPGTFEGSVGVTTDYIFRGISQTQEKPAVQTGLTWSHDSGVYLGFWGSNVDYKDNDESTSEMDAFIGYAQSIGNFSYDLGYISYFYPGTERNKSYDFQEVILGLGYDFNLLSLGTTVAWSPDYWGGSGESFYTAIDASVPLKYNITLDSGIGYQTMHTPSGYGLGNDYTEWHAGFTVPVKNFDVNVFYSDTDFSFSECGEICQDRFVASLNYNF
jgi:uncharacterized protein (TIGR02001 family)